METKKVVLTGRRPPEREMVYIDGAGYEVRARLFPDVMMAEGRLLLPHV